MTVYVYDTSYGRPKFVEVSSGITLDESNPERVVFALPLTVGADQAGYTVTFTGSGTLTPDALMEERAWFRAR